MTTWTEVDFRLVPTEPWRDILLAELADLGFEGFEETREGLRAYVATEIYDHAKLRGLSVLHHPHVRVERSSRPVPERNWNAEWERSFQPVEVDGEVRIRADFHPADPRFATELVITPRMAFGTGHHATTRMMIRAMRRLDLRGTAVCDLGCGTAVLAILAERMGAARVLAIDNDAQAVANARENVRHNGCLQVTLMTADALPADAEGFNAILANIERNTLLRAMPAMARALAPGGTLLLSGFLKPDVPLMQEAAAAAGLRPALELTEGEWSMVGCVRPNAA